MNRHEIYKKNKPQTTALFFLLITHSLILIEHHQAPKTR